MQDLILPVHCSCSVYGLKQMIAQHLKITDREQVLQISGEYAQTYLSGVNGEDNKKDKGQLSSDSKATSITLAKDDKFLFEYLPLTPFVEEELKKKDEQFKSIN